MRVLLPFFLLFLAALAQAGEIDAKVGAALAAESRPQADVERDRNRKPLATLKFFGLEDDMTVIEVLPGGGWYTRVLAPVLSENGKLYVALGTGRVSENVLTEPGFEKVEVLETAANVRRPDGSRYYALDDFEFGVSGVHWSWGNRQKKGGKQFSQQLSDKASNPDTARGVWEESLKLVGLA